MATESVATTVSDEALTGNDLGVYGLLRGFVRIEVDRSRDEARCFTDMDSERLAETENRARNVVYGAASALHTIGDLLLAHDSKIDQVHSVDVGSAVTMLADLLDGARLLEADAHNELQLRDRDSKAVCGGAA